MPARILAVSGSTRTRCRTRRLLDVAVEAARDAGATVRLLDLAETRLPVFQEDDEGQGDLPAVRQVRDGAEWAQGFLLATPEYHGSMSGALKNWFDFLWPQLAGKFAGVVVVTGGGGGDMAIAAVRTSFQWCRGFVLPFSCVARSSDFDGEKLRSEGVIDRLRRVGADVARYAPVLHRTYEKARKIGRGPAAGFAGL